VVQEWAGHSSMDTTRIYAHTNKIRMRNCVEGRKNIAV
jgi:site-specific recombinase XerD